MGKVKNKDLVSKVLSLVPNLEEDERFEEYEEIHVEAALEVAKQRAMEAQNPENFQRVEISYHNGGFFQEMPYVIGHGKLTTIKCKYNVLFFIRKWANRPEERKVDALGLSNLRSFRIL